MGELPKQKQEPEQDQPKQPKAQTRPLWVKIIRVLFKLLLVPILCVCALIGGLLIGYVYMGGQSIPEVFEVSTWKHMVDLVFASA